MNERTSQQHSLSCCGLNSLRMSSPHTEPYALILPLPILLLHGLMFSILSSIVALVLAPAGPASSSGAAAGSVGNALSAIPTPTSCPLVWRTVASENLPGYDHSLSGVGAAEPHDVWVVGSHSPGSQPLIEHWDGSQWSIYPAPSGGPLRNVSVISANDVWAVGVYAGFEQPFTVHWDGTSWSVIPSPQFSMGGRLEGVVGISANDVWAVGWYYVPGIYTRTLIMHWNGTQWNIVPSPNVGTNNNRLTDVAEVSANDIWAVGHCYDCYGLVYGTLTLHWDGTSWTVVNSPNIGTNNQVTGVAAIATDDVWAVAENDLIMHWNGSEWSVISHPTLPGGILLEGVAEHGTNDVWAVGYNTYAPPGRTVAMHWGGSEWNIILSPNPGSMGNWLFGVFALAETDVWAVGEQWSGGDFTTLIEHYSDQCAPPTATPIVTRTETPSPALSPTPGFTTTATSTAISTVTPPPTHTELVTATVTATSTSCPAQFTDVPPGSSFHSYINCLACRDIINGYSTGCETGNPCFRPNYSVTRGQISKIVSNAAGFPEPHTEQTFEDVPLTHTFYIYIERLASRGIISGYTCGGLGEPCIPPENRPYFRPANSSSRGQLSKIVCRAYNCTGTPTGQTFEDVPPTHPFYADIERLYTLGAMQGYPCGGPNEPCDPILNRPYFRPGSNVTRGQTSKIVSNTFFPECNTPGEK